MKKGFSIVEMAVVVIVIGIILAMIMEASGLVDTAKLKSDAQKIYKFEAAFGTFYTQYDRLPGSIAMNGAPAFSPKAVYEELTKAGLVQDSDFNASYIKGFWSFYGCNDERITAGTNTAGSFWRPVPMSTNNTNICIMGVFDNPRKDTRVIKTDIRNNSAISARFACFIDSMLDDRNFYFGKGRQNNENGELFTVLNPNCDSYSDRAGGQIGYVYRIF